MLKFNGSHPDARFNAATALASHGKAEALPVLLEMIEPDQSAIMQDEQPEARQFKQMLVNINGLRGSCGLADMNPAMGDADSGWHMRSSQNLNYPKCATMPWRHRRNFPAGVPKTP